MQKLQIQSEQKKEIKRMADVNVKDLLISIISPLIEEPSDLKVEVIETAKFISVVLSSNPADTGRIIGKQGRVINSIRTVVGAILARNGKKVDITVESGNESK
jgi:predicted RNA-binding protein YlqC (UPF0109 family)